MKHVQLTGQRKITNGKSMICKPKYRKLKIELSESHSNPGINQGAADELAVVVLLLAFVTPESGDKSWTGLQLRRTAHICGHLRHGCSLKSRP